MQPRHTISGKHAPSFNTTLKDIMLCAASSLCKVGYEWNVTQQEGTMYHAELIVCRGKKKSSHREFMVGGTDSKQQ